MSYRIGDLRGMWLAFEMVCSFAHNCAVLLPPIAVGLYAAQWQAPVAAGEERPLGAVQSDDPLGRVALAALIGALCLLAMLRNERLVSGQVRP
jgi:hypothetical protein